MTTQDFPYEVLEEFSRGGCSVIYKVKSLSRTDEKQFVLKTMTLGDDDPQSLQRFYMEYEFLRAYPHPNLIEVREYFQDWHGRPAYVMEWLQGSTWHGFWQERNALADLPTFLALFKQLCSGLDFIHKHQIIHRDLKPQNILISHEKVVKIIDFGIMKVADLTMYTQRNTFMGSAYYVAPEGVTDEQVTHTADIFSLGVILYDLFTGIKPFQGHTLGETVYQRLVKKPQAPSLVADVPPELDPIIHKMLEREPHLRQASCKEVYDSLEAALGKLQPRPRVEDTPNVDILTKNTLVHAHFIDACEAFLKEKNTLFLRGAEGAGKTTVAENLCNRLFRENTIKLDCRSSSNAMEFMEIILRSLHTSITMNRELKPWRDILGKALPGLRWTTEDDADQEHDSLNFSTIFSAFHKVLIATRDRCVMIIEDFHNAPDELVQFTVKLARIVSGRANLHLNLIITTRTPIADLAPVLGRPVIVHFPDLISLSEYLNHQFDNCTVPVELTQKLIGFSGENIGAFMRVVHQYKQSGQLTILDGILTLTRDQPPATEAQLAPSAAPAILSEFSPEETRGLEWIALCPDGIDLNILKAVTQSDIESLGATLNKAGQMGLLESQSSVTDGFRWKSPEAQSYLLSLLDAEERTRRLRILAQTIEVESKNYLVSSPALWLILYRLYRQANEEDKISDYGFRYARYCFQSSNYEPVRTYLGQLLSIPRFQNNQDFWCMLAMAYRVHDIKKALEYGQKALTIQENNQVFVMLAILEYHAMEEDKARAYLDRIEFGDDAAIDIHYLFLALPILIVLNDFKAARSLFDMIENKLTGRDDLYAANTLTLARLMLMQLRPAKLISAVQELKLELLPHTKRELHYWVSLAYQDLFQYEQAIGCLKYIDHNGMTDSRMFQELLLLYLNFAKTNEVKKLISLYRTRVQDHSNLRTLEPLFQLITEVLVQDPKVYSLNHILESLQAAGVERSSWLILITNLLEMKHLKPDFLKQARALIEKASVTWARRQLPRLTILAEVKSGRQFNLTQQLQQAVDKAHELGLIMETLRLYVLSNDLKRFGHTVAKIDFHLKPGFLESPGVFQYTRLNAR